MWLLSEHGAYWVGQNRNNPEEVLIRARRREHLEALRPILQEVRASLEILDTPAYDFPYRATLPRWAWALLAKKLAAGIDYGTFKGRLRDRHGPASPYYDFIVACWSRSFAMEDRDRGNAAGRFRNEVEPAEGLSPEGFKVLEEMHNEGWLDDDCLELYLESRGLAECLWCKEGGGPLSERVFSKGAMRFVEDRDLGSGWLCAECAATAQAETDEEGVK